MFSYNCAFGMACTARPHSTELAEKHRGESEMLGGGVTRVKWKSLDTMHITGERTLLETSYV